MAQSSIPARRKRVLITQATGTGELKVQIYNLNGERVAVLSAPPAGKVTTLTWNCGSAAPDVYVARLLQDGKEIGKTKVAVVR